MTIVAIHQPNYMPWLGYFYKIAKADLFIFLDDVEYSKNSFINRNRIKTANGPLWLTVPVYARLSQPICAIKFADADWRQKHLKTLCSAYAKAPFFGSVFPWFEFVLQENAADRLADLNMAAVRYLSEKLRLKCEFKKSSEFHILSRGDDRLIQLVKATGGSHYLSGHGGAHYQDPEKFKAANIELIYYSYQSGVYPQLWGEFIPDLSIIDVLFNIGPESTAAILAK